jgi:hypothetical protein
MLWWLIVGHAVMDWWAQSDALAMLKNRHHVRGAEFWVHALTAHAIMHGGAVAFVTGRVDLGIAETVAHWLTDFGKCEGWFGLDVDQGLHILAKLVWLAIAHGWLLQ